MELNEARLYKEAIYTMGVDEDGTFYNVMVPALGKETTCKTIKEAKEMIDFYQRDIEAVRSAIRVLKRNGYQVSKVVDKI